MAVATLQVDVREGVGKQSAKRLRREGMIPGVLYGSGDKPTSLSIKLKTLLTLLHSSGRNAVVDLSVGKSKKPVKSFLYDIQHDPLSGDIIHVDLKRISMTEIIHVSVAVRLNGMAVGVKSEGGIVEHTLHAIPISCLPADIPDTITIDISELHLGDSIHVSDLEEGNFKFLVEPETLIVHIVAPKIIVVEEEEEEEEEGVEALDEEGAEPEVIGEESKPEEE